jgi:hypothetical protein
MVSRYEKFVLVRSFPSLTEGHLAKNMLEAEGIRVLLEGVETTGALAGLHLALSGGVRLLVPSDDAPRAVGLLADLEARLEMPDGWEEEAGRFAVCSFCGEPVQEGRTECPACWTPCKAIKSSERMDRATTPSIEEAIRTGQPSGLTSRPPEAAREQPEAPRQGPGCLWAMAWLLPF